MASTTAPTTLPASASPLRASAYPPVPMARLVSVIVGACLVGMGIAVAPAQMDGALTPAIMTAALLGVAPTLLGGLGGMFTLRSVLASGHEGVNIATAVLACSLVRFFGMLALGLIVLLVIQPERKPFVHAFLVSGLAALTLETLLLRAWSAVAALPTAPAGASSPAPTAPTVGESVP